MVHVTTGESKQALKDFNRAIELDPKSVTAYTNRSFALVKLDRRQDGLADLDKAIQLDPEGGRRLQQPRARCCGWRNTTTQKRSPTSRVRSKSIPIMSTTDSHRREAYLKLSGLPKAETYASRIERLKSQSSASTEVRPS